jgi:hypothetical protein
MRVRGTTVGRPRWRVLLADWEAVSTRVKRERTAGKHTFKVRRAHWGVS